MAFINLPTLLPSPRASWNHPDKTTCTQILVSGLTLGAQTEVAAAGTRALPELQSDGLPGSLGSALYSTLEDGSLHWAQGLRMGPAAGEDAVQRPRCR